MQSISPLSKLESGAGCKFYGGEDSHKSVSAQRLLLASRSKVNSGLMMRVEGARVQPHPPPAYRPQIPFRLIKFNCTLEMSSEQKTTKIHR
jgi:hypothetical protein